MSGSNRSAFVARMVLAMGMVGFLPGHSAWAAEPSYTALLDSARTAILRGGYAQARELLDKAELASTSSPTPLSTEDVARLPFYRGAVEWYAGNRDEASLRHWRAAAVVSADLQPDPQLLPDSQARDVYYALRGEVRAGEQVELRLPDEATIFIDGRRPEASDVVPAGRHLVQVLCPTGTVGSAWHTYGAAPADYLSICSGVAYTETGSATAEAFADDPLNAVCPLMSRAELDASVARGREALFAEDIATVAAVDAELQKRLPCFRGSLVEPEQWAPHLVTLSIAAYARNLDWQTPLASALASLPTVSRAVGAGHPVGAWVAPAPAPATRTSPAGVEVYVDGRRVSYLPPMVGPHLVQLRDGKQFLTRYLPNGEAHAPWDELLAPFIQDAPPAASTESTATIRTARPGSGVKVAFIVTGAVVAAGGGGLLAFASSEEQALLADEQQLRQWALAGETAESVESDPAVQQVNTLYIAGFAAAGTGLALGLLGVVLPVSVTSVDGTPALLFSGAW